MCGTFHLLSIFKILRSRECVTHLVAMQIIRIKLNAFLWNPHGFLENREMQYIQRNSLNTNESHTEHTVWWQYAESRIRRFSIVYWWDCMDAMCIRTLSMPALNNFVVVVVFIFNLLTTRAEMLSLRALHTPNIYRIEALWTQHCQFIYFSIQIGD